MFVKKVYGIGTEPDESECEATSTVKYNKKSASIHNNSLIMAGLSNNGTTPTKNVIEIENLLEDNYTLNGLLIGARYTAIPDFNDEYLFQLTMLNSSFDTQAELNVWMQEYNPKIITNGQFNNRDTLRKTIVNSGTIVYKYDDVQNTVEVFNVRNSSQNERSKTKYTIDQFGNVRKKDLYTDDINSDSVRFKFNYLNQSLTNLDAYSDSTNFSYDGLQRLIRTRNPDASTNWNYYSYYDGFDTYFESIPGLVEKQTYKDEEGNDFVKYFDAVGNLIKEVKFTTTNPSPVEDFPSGALVTDYNYDSLYRLIKVKTPEDKIIYYKYDGYGNQSQRFTIDNGTTKYIYDKYGNLTYSQDSVQKSVNSNKFTFRNYDGLNRLTGTGEKIFDPESYADGSQYNSSVSSDYLTVNVYDTIANSIVTGLFNGVNNYNALNYTKERLAATAYRTRYSDSWSFKYYRYDIRGRVIKLWNIISGFDTLITEYKYNSQDQITFLYYQPGGDDAKSYCYLYDYAGRLSEVKFFSGSGTEDYGDYTNFSGYEYNKNSQISAQSYLSGEYKNDYFYNNRGWITAMTNTGAVFGFSNDYFKNGNVSEQTMTGSYSNDFSKKGNPEFHYYYDKSNRLKEAEIKSSGGGGPEPDPFNGNAYRLINTYDKDGNLLTLMRRDSGGAIADTFTYNYYSGTNKLRRVQGSQSQFRYDGNGNLTKDSLNNNTYITYDHRNLVTQFRHEPGSSVGVSESYTQTYYYYDEGGNRIRKRTYSYISGTPSSASASFSDDSLSNLPLLWELVNDEVYSRDINGRENCIYKNGTVEQWNVFGADNVGKFNGDGSLYFYYKDHLGSVRVVADDKNEVVSAQDYDAWGYILPTRSYQSDDGKFKFTGKERDEESGYDYFGARYYDARVGRWGGIEPLFEKYLGFSPYCYGINNPVKLIDVNGLDLTIGGDKDAALNDLKSLFADVTIQERITEVNGVVSFNTEGLDLASDAALELMDNLVNKSSNSYLYEVADNTYGYNREGVIEVFFLEKEVAGVVNLSVTERNFDGATGTVGFVPKDKFSGQVTLGTGVRTIPTDQPTEIPDDRWNTVFHELSESYYRTDKKMPYMYWDKSGAHQNAIDDASRFKRNTSINPGSVGRYIPPKN